MSTRPPQIRSGWVTFAAIITGIVAVYNILSGIAAFAEDDQTERIAEVLYGVDITAWGWFWLILGSSDLMYSGARRQRRETLDLEYVKLLRVLGDLM